MRDGQSKKADKENDDKQQPKLRNEMNRAKKIEYLQKLMAMQENKVEELKAKET
jgi:hypothetical protein